jgi:hypothetical protein
MSKPAVYLAGKIGKSDWRHSLIPGLRGHIWKDGHIELEQFTYTGPFFVACDHGCNHAPNSHGVAAGYFMGESNYTQLDVIRNNTQSLDQAELVFAYITALDCYGTVFELGYAQRAGKRVVLAFAPGVSRGDLWYLTHQANSVHDDVQEVDLPKLFRASLEGKK